MAAANTTRQNATRMTRRHVLGGLGLAALATALGACGGSPPATGGAPGGSAPASGSSSAGSAPATAATVAPKPAAQGAASGGKATTIDFWLLGGAPQAKIINDLMVAEYKKANPNVDVTLQMMSGWQDLYQKLLTSMAGNAPPDMSRIKDYWTPQFGTRGGLIELDKYTKASGIDPKRYVAQRWDSTQVAGKTLALPWTLFQHDQFYNASLLKAAGFVNADGTVKPPTTWDERREYAKKMTDPSKEQWGNQLYSTNNLEGTTYDWLDLLLEAGGQFMNEDRTKFVFNTPEAVAPIEYYLDMVYKDKSTVPPGVDVPNGVNGGKIGLWITGPWTIPTMKTQAPDLAWEVTLKPKFKNGAAALGGNNLAMYTAAKNQDATWQWLEFMAKPENDLVWNANAGYVPVQPANWDKPPYSTDKNWKIIAAQAAAPGNPTLPIVLDFQEILEAIAGELQQAYLQKKAPKDAINDGYEAATKILARSAKK